MKSGAALLVMAAIAAFAGNSLLARAAISPGLIEPGAFSAIRLAAGAMVLLPLMKRLPTASDLPGGVALLVYMLGFSFAYRDLPTATGALILFASVQATVIFGGVLKGERLGIRAIVGLALALFGVAWLLAPSAAAPAPVPTALMVVAGMAWGAYTQLGRGTTDPTAQTARNFLVAAPLAIPAVLLDGQAPSGSGVGLAVLAGVVTSALGYALWYRVAPRLGLGLIAGVQLATPVAAALAAAAFLSEPVTARLVLAGAIVLGGIALTLSPAGPPPSRHKSTP